MVHGNPWAGWSLGLRLLAPVLLAGALFLAFEECNWGDTGCDVTQGVLLGLPGLGLAIAMPIVDPLLAFEKRRSDIALTPWVSPRGDAGGLSLSGLL
jgi:hypothetical protein